MSTVPEPVPDNSADDWQPPPGMRRSMEAYWRDLPALLKSRHRGKWSSTGAAWITVSTGLVTSRRPKKPPGRFRTAIPELKASAWNDRSTSANAVLQRDQFRDRARRSSKDQGPPDCRLGQPDAVTCSPGNNGDSPSSGDPGHRQHAILLHPGIAPSPVGRNRTRVASPPRDDSTWWQSVPIACRRSLAASQPPR